MPRTSVKIADGRDFGIEHVIDEKPDNTNFALHNHDDVYEIVLFLNGDCEFLVEGNSYRLQPHDIMFTRPFELHRIVCLTKRTYERIILYVKEAYFEKNECEKYLDIFKNRSLGTGNLILRDMTDDMLHGCMRRIFFYCENGEYDVAERAVYEFLYLINRYKNMSADFYTKNEQVRNIIIYINRHLNEKMSLDELAKRFFMTKESMCRLFKRNTGHTINQYITTKRIILARELHRNGESLLSASMNAGFNNYSSFYKAYLKQMGTSPKKMDFV